MNNRFLSLVMLMAALVSPSASAFAQEGPNDEMTEINSLIDGNYYLKAADGQKVILSKAMPQVSPGGTGSRDERMTQMALYLNAVSRQDVREQLSPDGKAKDKYPTRYEFSGDRSMISAPKALEQIWLPGYKPESEGTIFLICLKHDAGKRYFEVSDRAAKELETTWINTWTHTGLQRVRTMMDDMVGVKRPVVGFLIKEPLPPGSYAVGTVETLTFFYTFDVD